MPPQFPTFIIRGLLALFFTAVGFIPQHAKAEGTIEFVNRGNTTLYIAMAEFVGLNLINDTWAYSGWHTVKPGKTWTHQTDNPCHFGFAMQNTEGVFGELVYRLNRGRMNIQDSEWTARVPNDAWGFRAKDRKEIHSPRDGWAMLNFSYFVTVIEYNETVRITLRPDENTPLVPLFPNPGDPNGAKPVKAEPQKPAADPVDIPRIHGMLGYSRVEGDKPDYNSETSLRQSAESNQPAALKNLAVFLYNQADTTPETKAEVVDLFRRSGEADSPSSMNMYAYLLDQGYGVEEDPERALDGFRKAAKEGNREAAFNVAAMTAAGRGVPADPQAALDMFWDNVDNRGGTANRYWFGRMYFFGLGVPRDRKKGMNQMRVAANGLHLPAIREVEAIYRGGRYGYDFDYAEVHRWRLKGAKTGDTDFMIEVALDFLHGRGEIKSDRGEAEDWLRKAADQGEPKAVEMLDQYFGGA